MKFTLVLALVATALASPTNSNQCKPATFACATIPQSGAQGRKECDVTSQWVVRTSRSSLAGVIPECVRELALLSQYAGDCPPHTVCRFLAANGSPYCIPA